MLDLIRLMFDGFESWMHQRSNDASINAFLTNILEYHPEVTNIQKNFSSVDDSKGTQVSRHAFHVGNGIYIGRYYSLKGYINKIYLAENSEMNIDDALVVFSQETIRPGPWQENIQRILSKLSSEATHLHDIKTRERIQRDARRLMDFPLKDAK